jgi:hypothetical protein
MRITRRQQRAGVRLYIDTQEIYINQVICKYKLEAFRSYSSVSAAGGGQTKTSASGGGESLTRAEQRQQHGRRVGRNRLAQQQLYRGIKREHRFDGSGDTGSSGAGTTAAGGTTGSTYTDVSGMSSSTDGAADHIPTPAALIPRHRIHTAPPATHTTYTGTRTASEAIPTA